MKPRTHIWGVDSSKYPIMDRELSGGNYLGGFSQPGGRRQVLLANLTNQEGADGI